MVVDCSKPRWLKLIFQFGTYSWAKWFTNGDDLHYAGLFETHQLLQGIITHGIPKAQWDQAATFNHMDDWKGPLLS